MRGSCSTSNWARSRGSPFPGTTLYLLLAPILGLDPVGSLARCLNPCVSTLFHQETSKKLVVSSVKTLLHLLHRARFCAGIDNGGKSDAIWLEAQGGHLPRRPDMDLKDLQVS